MTPDRTVLRLHHITKRFGSLVANDDISLSLESGQVLALLGENGAGKSTLVSILFGDYQADAGHIEVFGQALPPGDPHAALEAGIGMVHQHFTLAANLSVLDNVIMGTEPPWAWRSQRQQARTRLLEVGRRFGLVVDPDAMVEQLSVGERQRVEILKALYRGARILILDEPTAVLTPQESEQLFEVLGQMVAEDLAIIFISHKLPEVLRVSHRIAVLRNGRLVADQPTAQTTQADLVQAMVGAQVELPERRPTQRVGARVCELQSASTDERARERLSGVNLQLHAGEIVAVAGVSGNGQLALAQVLCGMRALRQGSLHWGQESLRQLNPARCVALGVARIPEDRHALGVVGDLSVWENCVSERLRSSLFSRWGWIRRAAAQAYAEAVVRCFDVRTTGLQASTRTLSGGNMQKLILGRALLHPLSDSSDSAPLHPDHVPSLIVAHQPTWGLDIGAVNFVQNQLLAARDAGAAVLLISDDLDEVLTLGDRVAVMHAGHLSAALPATAWTREGIGHAMAGLHEHPAAQAEVAGVAP